MLSAPATIPATSEAIFNPAFAPLSVGTLRYVSASSRRPAELANAITGTSPADDTRFGSSKSAEIAHGLWHSCIYEMPFVTARTWSQTNPILPTRRAFSRHDALTNPNPSVDPGLASDAGQRLVADLGEGVDGGFVGVGEGV
jgi:hypothetical protein